MSSDTFESPMRPGAIIQREYGQIDLAAHVRKMREDNQAFADALQQRRRSAGGPGANALVRVNNNSTASLLIEEGTAGSGKARLENQSAVRPANARLALERYAQHMAERALTHNGRGMKAKATTAVFTYHQLCYNSAYTRPAEEMLRETMAVIWPQR
ncbi:hypothetical protein LTR53_002517 [Teratosphaeriaceae sp. CCFEE 6253]|nr:hypothetical protein LTR53_002517 [Teratosphaeriaceae sp. CCFEE 6253]